MIKHEQKVYLNDEIEKLTGYHRDDFMSNKVTLLDLYHPEEKERVKIQNRRSFTHRKPYKLPVELDMFGLKNMVRIIINNVLD